MRLRGLTIACCVGLLLSGLAGPVSAEKGDKQVRFGILYSSPTDDLVSGMQTTEFDGALGFQGSFEFLVTDRIGIEPGLAATGHDLTVVEPGFADAEGDSDVLTLTANINFHFEKESGLDIFVGPTIGYAFWDDITLDGFMLPVPTDDEFVLGVNFGLDVPFGEGGWAFHFGANYLVFDAPATGGDIGFSPLQGKAGLTYSF